MSETTKTRVVIIGPRPDQFATIEAKLIDEGWTDKFDVTLIDKELDRNSVPACDYVLVCRNTRFKWYNIAKRCVGGKRVIFVPGETSMIYRSLNLLAIYLKL